MSGRNLGLLNLFFCWLDGHGFGGLQNKTSLNTQNTPPVPPSRLNLPTPKPYSFGDGGSFNFRPCCWVSLGYQLWLMITWRRPKVYQYTKMYPKKPTEFWPFECRISQLFQKLYPDSEPSTWLMHQTFERPWESISFLLLFDEIDLLKIFFFWLSSPWETLRPTLPPTSQHLCWRKGDKTVTT